MMFYVQMENHFRNKVSTIKYSAHPFPILKLFLVVSSNTLDPIVAYFTLLIELKKKKYTPCQEHGTDKLESRNSPANKLTTTRTSTSFSESVSSPSLAVCDKAGLLSGLCHSASWTVLQMGWHGLARFQNDPLCMIHSSSEASI